MNFERTAGFGADPEPQQSEPIELRLYVAGQTLKSLEAIANLRLICQGHFTVRYAIEVIDLMADPQRARSDQIVAIPTLVRALPTPVRKVIGNLSNIERVLVGLDLLPNQRKDL